MIYLDNAASSFPKPQSVVSRAVTFLRENGANPGRSGHFLSAQASEAVFEVRDLAASFFSADPESVVFTKNATEGLNCAIAGLSEKGKTCVISDIEHNSVIRPVMRLKQRGETSVFVLKTGENMFSELEKKLSAGRISFVAMSHASNVTGEILPLEEVYSLCRKSGIPLINDASQTAGFLEYEPGDILCMPGHKGLYGPQGTGLMIFRNRELLPRIRPLLAGGTGTDSADLFPPEILPESFEAGTLNTPGICGLGEGISFVKRKAAVFRPRETRLRDFLLNGLLAMPGIEVYSSSGNSVPVLSFNVAGFSSEAVTEALSLRGICVRGGLHCAPFCHEKLGTLSRKGAVRVSLGAFNKQEECEIFLREIKRIAPKKEK